MFDKEPIVVACFCILFLGVSITVGYNSGEVAGHHSVYKGTTTCETLLDGAIRCVETTKVKGK